MDLNATRDEQIRTVENADGTLTAAQARRYIVQGQITPV